MPQANIFKLDTQVINYLKSNLDYGSHILELGSGEGTIELLDHFKVTSVEHDREWLDKVNHPNHEYIYCPLDDNTGWFKDLGVPDNYDALIIDSPPAYENSICNSRMGFLDNIHLFRLDVPIIIDDTDRNSESLLAEILKEYTGKSKIYIANATILW